MIVGSRSSVIEPRLRQRVLRSVYRIAAPGIKAASGSHREEGEEGERSDDPGERICFGATGWGRRSSWSSAAVAESGAGAQISGARSAGSASQRGTTIGAVVSIGGGAA